jgi:cell division protein FtsI/penicillin-binding protein 2/cell division protein FtsW (lipid II flippase)
MARDNSRRAEGSLLVFVLFILGLGFLLVFLAKTRAGLPADALNLNQASPDELAVAFELDPGLASLLIKHRERLGRFDHVDQLYSLTLFPTWEEQQQVRETLRQSKTDPNTETVEGLVKRLELSRPVARRIVAYRNTLPDRSFKRPDSILRAPLLKEAAITSLGDRLVVRHPATVFWQFVMWGGLAMLLYIGVPVFLRKSGVRGDPFLLPLGLLLSGIGVMTLFSVKDPLRDTPVYVHHIQGLILGAAALVAGAAMPLQMRRNLRRYAYVWALAALALLGGLWLFGHGPEGVRLSMGPFQPVEIVKLLLIFFVAGYLADHGELMADALHRWRPPLPKGWGAKLGIAWPRWQDWGPILGVYGVALLLFLVVKDMGPALLLFGTFIGVLYLATGRAGIVMVGLGLMLVGGVLGHLLHVGVLPVRVDMWRSPWSNPHANGMQLGQTLWAMASGGICGTGLGLGSPGTVPRSGSDMVFGSVAEELGLVGAIALLTLYCLLISRGLRIALHTQNDFDRLLAAGLTVLLACQTFLIIAGATGLLPLTGITLPFISSGNSSLVADFFLLGLLRGISAPTGSVAVGATKPLFRRTVRHFATAAAVALLGLIGVGRLFYVQAIAADNIAGRAIRTPDADRVVRAKINPRLLELERAIPRGSIYDRKGRVLATSRLDEISAAMEDAPEKARRLYRKGRYYPRGSAFAHLLGYLDPALGGPTDMERDFHRQLRGFDAYSELLGDYRAKDLPGWLTGRGQRVGHDLVTTFDADLQEAALRVLKEAAGRLTDQRTGRRKESAAMVVIDPLSGEVLASASTPTFDPNTLSLEKWQAIQKDEDKSHRMLDRSRYGYYPPGSTLKVATGCAAMEEGLDPRYDCNHVMRNLRWTYHEPLAIFHRRQLLDDKGDPPHNVLRMPGAVTVSCNLYFANLGVMMGSYRLHRAFSDPDRWSFSKVKPVFEFATELPTNAFGQGNMLASPTEMARVAAAVANRGAMMQPIYWKEVRERGGKTVTKNRPTVMSRPVGPDNAARMAQMMRSVVTDGTARGVFDALPVEVAGKTGTAQTDSGDRQPHSWFIGFTPVSKPQYAFACVIEHGGYGKRGAAPAVRDVLATIFGAVE